MIERGATRRELVTGVAGATAVGSLAAARAGWAATAPAGGDSGALDRVLRIEQLVVFAYRQVLSSPALSPAATQAVHGILAHELEHVATLERALGTLGTLGAGIPAGPAGVIAAQRALDSRHVARSLTNLGTQHNALKLLIDVESLAEGAYFGALSKLRDAALLRMAVEIMGSEAQHWTILSALLNRGNVMRSVPYPFVQGSM